MGQEISLTQFDPGDFAVFLGKLREETAQLGELFACGAFSHAKPKIGYEIEAWLIAHDLHPAPVNRDFLASLHDPMASAELPRATMPSMLALNEDVIRQDCLCYLLERLSLPTQISA